MGITFPLYLSFVLTIKNVVKAVEKDIAVVATRAFWDCPYENVSRVLKKRKKTRNWLSAVVSKKKTTGIQGYGRCEHSTCSTTVDLEVSGVLFTYFPRRLTAAAVGCNDDVCAAGRTHCLVCVPHSSLLLQDSLLPTLPLTHPTAAWHQKTRTQELEHMRQTT